MSHVWCWQIARKRGFMNRPSAKEAKEAGWGFGPWSLHYWAEHVNLGTNFLLRNCTKTEQFQLRLCLIHKLQHKSIKMPQSWLGCQINQFVAGHKIFLLFHKSLRLRLKILCRNLDWWPRDTGQNRKCLWYNCKSKSKLSFAVLGDARRRWLEGLCANFMASSWLKTMGSGKMRKARTHLLPASKIQNSQLATDTRSTWKCARSDGK